ncbi:hypothetical protein FRC98_15865 [Lujinxingia vulgaris]|uniref:Thioredoxin domain-containing protein n=1 Tax=Lujinxingia vulgaris TaxID=2600176 RepID=A0A5C6X1T7_9DELT|nr:hypothetical protein [Lujinxingia vulgaris]TXD35680.1 hypothetical protein FRC98_15865 [Lujinxingia vulgaris]
MTDVRSSHPTRIFAALLGALLTLAITSTTAHAGPDVDLTELQNLPDLQRIYGEGPDTHVIASPAPDKLRVYWFWSANSHCSKEAEPAIASLIEAFPDIEVIVVHANADESIAEARDAATERGLPFSIYRDDRARLAIALNARMTPEVVVLSAEGVVYQGRPVHIRRGTITSYVARAVDAWSRSEAVEPAYRRPTGCPIPRP